MGVSLVNASTTKSTKFLMPKRSIELLELVRFEKTPITLSIDLVEYALSGLSFLITKGYIIVQFLFETTIILEHKRSRRTFESIFMQLF